MQRSISIPTELSLSQGDVLADFSLRGPDPAPYQDIQKPDITGPGVNIYAASPLTLEHTAISAAHRWPVRIIPARPH